MNSIYINQHLQTLFSEKCVMRKISAIWHLLHKNKYKHIFSVYHFVYVKVSVRCLEGIKLSFPVVISWVGGKVLNLGWQSERTIALIYKYSNFKMKNIFMYYFIMKNLKNTFNYSGMSLLKECIVWTDNDVHSHFYSYD